MIYMCAISLHFCEECQNLIRFQQNTPANLPLHVLVKVPSTHTETTTITNGKAGGQRLVGSRINLNWRIRKCLGCRDKTSSAVAVELSPAWEIPEDGVGRYPSGWELTFPQLCHVELSLSCVMSKLARLSSNQFFRLSAVSRHLNSYFGGPAGVEAAKNPTKDCDAKTWSRIIWYQCQE